MRSWAPRLLEKRFATLTGIYLAQDVGTLCPPREASGAGAVKRPLR